MNKMNLYGTKPYRTWIMMKNYSQRMSDPEAYRDHGTSQFSSQEKNQEDLDNILHQVHDDFHNYFILIIISLTAFISAILILLIIVTLCSYCRKSKHNTCQAQNYNPNVPISNLPSQRSTKEPVICTCQKKLGKGQPSCV